MAAGSLLLLLDDIASALDDVATMTKVAAYKTAGVLGDDLALNAQQLSGVAADREWRVVWAVAKGSLGNKLVLVPAAILLSAFAPWAVLPLLVCGGAYLCFEGTEKLAHDFLHPAAAAEIRPGTEHDRVRGAIRTDFILSAEITVIALGSVSAAPLGVRIGVLAAVGVLMTIGVYGLVAAIVKLDDVGLHLVRRAGPSLCGRAAALVGRGLIGCAPLLMRALSVLGTVAMFVVGGGIIVHGIPALGALTVALQANLSPLPLGSALRAALSVGIASAGVGVVVGLFALALARLVALLRAARTKQS